jgi:hypothetical protein
MKKLLIILCLLSANQVFVMAQHFEITGFGGYVFPSTWYASYGNLHYQGSAQYGGMLSLGASRVMDFDFIYNRIDTKVNVTGSYYDDNVPVSMNYWMLGGTKNFRVNPVISPFIGLNLGGCVMSPKSTDTYDYGNYNYWFFAMGFDAGLKVYINKVIGLRLQGQILMPVQSGGFYFSGAGSSVYLTSTLVEGGFTGGIIFRIGEIK